MKSLVATLCIAGLLALPPVAGAAEVHVIDFDKMPTVGLLSIDVVPDEPLDNVVDQPGALPPATLEATENKLGGSERAPVYLALLEGALPAEPQLYGNEILRRWISGDAVRLAAIVLSVVEPSPSTHVVLAGRNLDREDIEDLRALANAALRMASEEASASNRAAAIATGLVPALDTFAAAYDAPLSPAGEGPAEAATAGAPTDSTPAPAAGGSATAGEFKPEANRATSSHWDILAERLDWALIRLVAWIAGGILTLALLIFVLPKLLRRRRYQFPEHEPRQRFDGPYAGGSNAQVNFGSR